VQDITFQQVIFHIQHQEKNNASPYVTQYEYISEGYVGPIQYSINSDQYGRTFQDRSYVFNVVAPPSNIDPTVTNIWNLNVRGKRGDIVDVFPSTEYDFTPQILNINQNDYIHFQWIGSDYNPNRTPNAAVGGPLDIFDNTSYRADRSNIVQISLSSSGLARKLSDVTMFFFPNGTQNVNLINSFAMLNQPGLTSTNPYIMCLNFTALTLKYGGNTQSATLDNQNCMNLSNAPSPYFDGGLVQMLVTGRFAYMSTRNNNFSNRSQKGLIIVGGSQYANAHKASATIVLLQLSFFILSLFL